LLFEELDFIPACVCLHAGMPLAWLRTGINYDIKYRMGKALFGEDDAGEE